MGQRIQHLLALAFWDIPVFIIALDSIAWHELMHTVEQSISLLSTSWSDARDRLPLLTLSHLHVGSAQPT
jgi:hypothetical protein